MKRLRADFIAESISGEIVQGSGNLEIKGVSIDSRTIKKDEVFFAIVGERYDGHDFVNSAIEKGATAVVVNREMVLKDGITVIKVMDTSKALQELAKAYRLLLKNLKVIAITGSVGKTTTKDIIASLLKSKYKTKKTSGNLNNYYGLPLTLLDFTGDEELAVLEMGMSQIGEISLLSEIAKPEIAVITNVGETHLETLGSVEKVAEGKSELIKNLADDGIAILNYDNKFVRNMNKVFRGKEIIYYGLTKEADIYADNILSYNNRIEFSVHYQGEVEKIRLDRTGLHNIYNSLAAIATARQLGISWQEIKEGFYNVEYSSLRWDLKEVNGITIINDTYNANPISMRASIDAAEGMNGSRLLLVLGAMLELGEREKMAHLALGDFIHNKKVDLLVTVGEIAKLIARASRKSGMEDTKIVECENNQEVLTTLRNCLKTGDVLLVKGSRGLKMEEIVKGLL